MLDQNTDRMWFVIGAVIVGAAIIFIANGTLPTLFASVSDSFEESAEKGTTVIDRIGERNLYTAGDYYYSGQANSSGTIGQGKESVLEKNIEVKPNTTYELSYTTPESHRHGLFIITNSKPSDNISHNYIFSDARGTFRELYTKTDVVNDKGRLSHVFKTTEDERYVSITTGNSNPYGGLVPFAPYELTYNDIRLVEVFE